MKSLYISREARMKSILTWIWQVLLTEMRDTGFAVRMERDDVLGIGWMIVLSISLPYS